jgi:1,4-dihydroxy-2-naphthoyl-CoA synthase
MATQTKRTTSMLEDLTDVTYEIGAGVAWITITRRERLNSFRAHTDELIACFKHAWVSADVGVVSLTGASPRSTRNARPTSRRIAQTIDRR